MKHIHFGPGSGWEKPNKDWITIDIDPQRGDIVMDLNKFSKFDIETNSISSIYASHTFEHVSMLVIDKLWSDCSRILKKGGVMRIIVPDPVKSMNEYISGNKNFSLFKHRRKHNPEWTLFECLKADFISKSGQPQLLGNNGLAHQNAWDFETIKKQLIKCGFSSATRSQFQKSCSPHFDFEGSYESEANHTDRSMYVEAIK